MKILTVLVGLSDAPEIVKSDAIRWKGKLWLVPTWLVEPSRGVRRPERLVRFDQLQYEKASPEVPADFVLREPIARAVLKGPIEAGCGHEIVANPRLEFPIPKTSLN